MTDQPEPKAVEIEIRIDGRVAHRFFAERVTTSEDSEHLSLNAARWQPSKVTIPPNPIFDDVEVSVGDQLFPMSGFGFRHGSDLGVLAGDFLNQTDISTDDLVPGALFAVPEMTVSTEMLCRKAGTRISDDPNLRQFGQAACRELCSECNPTRKDTERR